MRYRSILSGDDSVQFWLKEMELYYKNELDMDIVDSAIYGMAEHFMSSKSHDIWSEDVVWEVDDKGVNRIKTFRYSFQQIIFPFHTYS